MTQATGIGGVFFRSADPSATIEWYRRHLGVEPEPAHTSATFRSRGGEATVLATFAADTDYFGGSGQQFMVNLRVDDLDAVLRKLAEAGVKVEPEIEDGEYGRFGWVEGCDGRRVELWEPPGGA